MWGPAVPAAPGRTILGKLKLSYIKITEQDTWHQRVTPSTGSFFDWFGSRALWLHSMPQTLGVILLTVIITIPQHTVPSQKL